MTQPDTGPQATAPKKLQLHPAALGLAVVLLAARVVHGSRVSSNEAMAYHMGAFAGAMLVAFIVGWIGYRLARRSSAVFNILFAIIVSVHITGETLILWRTWNRPANDRALAALESQRQQALDNQRRQLDDAGVIETKPEDIDNTVEMIKKASDQAAGEEGLALKVAAEVLQGMSAASKRYVEASREFTDAGGIDASTLHDPSDIQTRLRMLTDIAKLNADLKQVTHDAPDALRASLAAAGITPENATRLASNFEAGLHLNLVDQVRNAEESANATMREYLVFLGDTWGQWTLDPTDRSVVFKDDELMSRLSSFAERLQESNDILVQAQHDIVEVQEQDNRKVSPR